MQQLLIGLLKAGIGGLAGLMCWLAFDLVKGLLEGKELSWERIFLLLAFMFFEAGLLIIVARYQKPQEYSKDDLQSMPDKSGQ